MNRRVLIALVSAAAVLLLGLGWTLTRATSGGSTDASPSTAATAAPGEVSAAIKRCTQMSTGSDAINQPAIDCFKSALRLAISSDHYDEVLAQADDLNHSEAYGTCHNAAHQIGVALIEEGNTMQDVLQTMFKGKEAPPEDVCTLAIVHGLVQGNVQNDPPYDMDYLAAQCLSLMKVNPRYANECSHYYGHATWKTVGSISADLADLCAKLEPGDSADTENACMAGAVMTKYGLQEGYGDETVSKQLDQPPAYTDAIHLCDPLAAGRVKSYEACWGGIGWLLALRANHTLEPLRGTDLDSHHEESVAEWVTAMNYCKGIPCMSNFMTHFAFDDYHNGVVRDVCLSPDAHPDVDRGYFYNFCNIMLERRTGTGLDGKPADQSSSDPT